MLILIEPQGLAERWPGDHARHHCQGSGAERYQDHKGKDKRAWHHDLSRQHMLNDVKLGAADGGAR